MNHRDEAVYRLSPSDQPCTAAELLRQKRKAGKAKPEPSVKVISQPPDDIDEEIRRLEAELANESDEDEHDSSDVETNSETEDDSRGTVLCLSSVQKDRIEPLPSNLLPSNRKRSLKGIDRVNASERDDADQSNKKKSKLVSSGLEAAVKEVLDGYVPRSSERLPFYCRVCAQQMSDEDSFTTHKETEFHTTAVEMERKRSFCKLCRKQLTSPAQLQEHLSSRPHRERLDWVRQKQGNSASSHGRASGRNASRGRGGRVENRQWS